METAVAGIKDYLTAQGKDLSNIEITVKIIYTPSVLNSARALSSVLNHPNTAAAISLVLLSSRSMRLSVIA